MTVVAVCGLKVEVRIAQGTDVVAVAGGGHPLLLADDIERAIAEGARAVISFGIAGALDPTLRPGRLIVADRVVTAQRTFAVDAAWSGALMDRTGASPISLAAGDDMAVTTAIKARLRTATGAAAVDMESHVAARIAAAHGLPFVVLRAIADPAGRSLPPAATIAMKPGGGVDLAAVLRSIVRSPGQLPELIAIARDTQAALRGLRHGRRLLGRGLGYLDLDQLGVDVV
jgi:hopanoid-associated phosphorylase